MGTFVIKSETKNGQYEYKDTQSQIFVNGGYSKDATTSDVISINGSCYRLNAQEEPSDYIGNFNGYVRDGVLKYDLTEMTRQDANKVWDAIDEIEANVEGEN